MKIKIALLLISIALLSFTVVAGVDPAVSKKQSAQKQIPGSHAQLRIMQHGMAVVTSIECGTAASYTNPINIPDNDTLGIYTTINVSGIPGTNLGSDVFLTRIHVSGHHTWMGDLILSITAPNGASVELMNRPGFPLAGVVGCQFDNFTFDVVPGMGADNENTCDSTDQPALYPGGEYAISGAFSAMSGFDLDSINIAGGDPNGAWTLFGSDNYLWDSGWVDTLTMYFTGANSIFSYSITGATVDFSAPAIGGATMSWDFGDGNTGTGTTSSHTYNNPGTYLVNMYIETPADTCYTSQFVTPAIFTGMKSLSGPGNFMIFPNPSSGIVDVSFKKVASNNAELILYDSFGRTLKIQNLMPGIYHQSFDISSWSKGVYYVKLIDQDATNIQKLILR